KQLPEKPGGDCAAHGAGRRGDYLADGSGAAWAARADDHRPARRRRCQLVCAAVGNAHTLGSVYPTELAPCTRFAQSDCAGCAGRAAQPRLVGAVALASRAATERRGPAHPARSSAPRGPFWMIAALGHLLLIVVWNPDYGGQRDWDL